MQLQNVLRLKMKEINTCVLLLALSNVVMADLERQIEMNKLQDKTTKGATSKRTIRTYKTFSKPPFKRIHTTTASIIDKTCLLKPDEGPCRAKIIMWYFEPVNRTCLTFTWGGCQGNGNRYDLRKECMETCLSKPGEKSHRPRYCTLSFDYGWCFGADERWYFDKVWGVCKKTIYSGCGGNKNNFYNKEQCDNVCRFGKIRLGHTTTTPADEVKRILIVNPREEEDKETTGGNATTSAAITRGGNWWLKDLKNKNKKFFEVNRNASDETTVKADGTK